MTLYIGVAGASRPEVVGGVAAGEPEAPRPEAAGGGAGAPRPEVAGGAPGAPRPERPGAAVPDLRLLEQAERLGRRLAEAGAVVVCGGMDGVMDGAARGAREAGGHAVGILGGLSREGASPSLTVAVPTGMGEARNALVVRAADAVIAVGGEFGTLSEIALALKAGKPVVGLDTWQLSRGGEEVDAVIRASTPEEAVRRALSLAGSVGGSET
jgi:uncharacterized protein (TIGR00725 family)